VFWCVCLWVGLGSRLFAFRERVEAMRGSLATRLSLVIWSVGSGDSDWLRSSVVWDVGIGLC